MVGHVAQALPPLLSTSSTLTVPVKLVDTTGADVKATMSSPKAVPEILVLMIPDVDPAAVADSNALKLLTTGLTTNDVLVGQAITPSLTLIVVVCAVEMVVASVVVD